MDIKLCNYQRDWAGKDGIEGKGLFFLVVLLWMNQMKNHCRELVQNGPLFLVYPLSAALADGPRFDSRFTRSFVAVSL